MSEHHTEDLLHYVERIEEAEAEKRAATDILRGVYAEAKDAGYVPALLRQVVRERRLDAYGRSAQYVRLDQYRRELGLFADTPLGEAALRASNVTPYPRPFAEQPVHQDRDRRPRKSAAEAAEDLLGA